MASYPPAPTPSAPVSYGYVPASQQAVVITDIDMTIGAMCRFMVKWVIATIPAFLILWLLMFVIGLVFAAIFGGWFHAAHPYHWS